MIEYHWEILSLYTAQQSGLPDVVTRATWRRVAREDSWAVDMFQDTLFDPADAADYTAYADLEPDTVIGWIESKVNVTEIDQQLAQRLADERDPGRVREKSLPWREDVLYRHDDWYALFHEGQCIWGPIHWNSDSFNNALERVGLERSFPNDIHVRQRRILPTRQPLVVDAATNTVLYLCELENSQPEDSIFDADDQLEWRLDQWPVVARYVSQDRPLQHVKDRLREHVAGIADQAMIAERELEISAGRIIAQRSGPLQAVWLLTQLGTIGAEGTVPWRSVSGEWLTLSRTDLETMLKSLQQRDQVLRTWHRELDQQIQDAGTVSALRALDITTPGD